MICVGAINATFSADSSVDPFGHIANPYPVLQAVVHSSPGGIVACFRANRAISAIPVRRPSEIFVQPAQLSAMKLVLQLRLSSRNPPTECPECLQVHANYAEFTASRPIQTDLMEIHTFYFKIPSLSFPIQRINTLH